MPQETSKILPFDALNVQRRFPKPRIVVMVIVSRGYAWFKKPGSALPTEKEFAVIDSTRRGCFAVAYLAVN
jgi:hypothetical protein